MDGEVPSSFAAFKQRPLFKHTYDYTFIQGLPEVHLSSLIDLMISRAEVVLLTTSAKDRDKFHTTFSEKVTTLLE